MGVLLLNGNQGNNLIQITVLAFIKGTLLSVLVSITHNSFLCGVQKIFCYYFCMYTTQKTWYANVTFTYHFHQWKI